VGEYAYAPSSLCVSIGVFACEVSPTNTLARVISACSLPSTMSSSVQLVRIGTSDSECIRRILDSCRRNNEEDDTNDNKDVCLLMALLCSDVRVSVSAMPGAVVCVRASSTSSGGDKSMIGDATTTGIAWDLGD
jgi:hypothetical protein